MDEVVRIQKVSEAPFKPAMGSCFIGEERIIGNF